MAARKTYEGMQLDLYRDKIKTAQLVKRLQANALGELELNAIQQRSAEILLKKTLPDLCGVEHKGAVATYVARLPSVATDITAWSKSIEDDKPVTLVLPTTA